MSSSTLSDLADGRAKAYDEIYQRWHAKHVTVEWFDRVTRSFLDAPDGELGHLNGNEIRFALERLGLDEMTGTTVLDYCCGTGVSAIYFALRGARVHAFDASAQAIELAQESARLSGVADRVSFSVMDAQALDFPSDRFDAVFCQSALHIIVDYPACGRELSRVLKPSGRAIFCEEALGHNILLAPVRWLRRRKYLSCGGRTLTYADIRQFGRPFRQTRIHHFNLLLQVKQLLGERVARPWPKRVMRGLDRLDRRLLRRMPWLERYCGKVVVEYTEPIRPVPGE